MIWGCTVQGAMVRVPLFPVERYLQALSAPGRLASHLLEILRDPVFLDRMLAHYEPDTTFGIRNQEEKLPAVDDPSLQTGAAGAALALLAASGTLEAWDAVFLMA